MELGEFNFSTYLRSVTPKRPLVSSSALGVRGRCPSCGLRQVLQRSCLSLERRGCTCHKREHGPHPGELPGAPRVASVVTPKRLQQAVRDFRCPAAKQPLRRQQSAPNDPTQKVAQNAFYTGGRLFNLVPDA